MSSPFDTFRTHKNYWMAGMVLLAILAFIVAPAIEGMMNYVRSSGDAGGTVLMRWSEGKVTLATADYVRMQHSRTVRFLQALAREVITNGGMPKVPGFRYDTANKRVEDLGLPMLTTNRTVCQTMIIAARAKQLGIELDKPVVDDFFKRFCDRKVSSKRFEELLTETAGRELPVSELYRQLELELSAVVMERLALAGVNYEGMPLLTPGNLWQNYLRLNQSARVEAFPVLTSEYVKQVKETPSETEIRALYEAGSMNFPSPNSPEAGFRRRYQADIEYVSGSWNKMLEIEKAKITEEAIRAEYDRQVGIGGLQVPVAPPPPTPGESTSTDAGADKPAGTQPTGDKPEEKPAADTPSQPTAAQPEAGQAPAPKDDAAKDDAAKDDAAKDDGAKDDVDSDAQSKAGGDKPADDANPQSSNTSRKRSRVRLVALQQGDDLPPPVDNPPPPGEDAQTTSATADGSGSAAGSPNAPMRTQTFEEAKDSLARSLAMNVVRDQLQNKLSKIESQMNDYAARLEMERSTIESGRKVDKPTTRLDLKKIAEAEGLTYGSTGMIDGFRLATTPIGRSMIGNESLANAVLNENVRLYQPVRSMFIDMANATEPDFQEFISWKTAQEPAYTPALVDIRDEVIEAWKTQRAREFAKEEAEKLAAKMRKAGEESWKSTLDADQQTLVVSPPPFTWMSAPREMFAPAQVTFVQGLDTVGNEFMQRVFAAPAGEVLVAPNQGLSTYYVVRLVELSPTLDQLRQNFEVSRGRARQLAFSERERLFSEWYDNIERTLNVQWLAGNEALLD